jgi:hypothetical protein
MILDPPEPTLVLLETDAAAVVGKDWYSRLDKVFTNNLGKYRKYKGNSVRDLLRAMRNKVSDVFPYSLASIMGIALIRGLETPLPRPRASRQATFGLAAFWFPALFHLAIPRPVPTCLWGRQGE